MVQIAVALKDGDWTVFRDGEPIERDLTRSSAIQMAKIIAFEAEERGHSVELLIHSCYGGAPGEPSGGPEPGAAD